MGGRQRTFLLGITVVLGIVFTLACAEANKVQVLVPGIDDACQPLGQAETYRYKFTYDLESPEPEEELDESLVGEPPFALPPNAETFSVDQTYNGEVQRPDRTLIEVTSETAGLGGSRLLFIGDDQWVYLNGEWVESRPQEIPFAPLRMCDAMLSGIDFTSLEGVEDEVNGRSALRYEIEDAKLDTAVDVWSESSDQGRLLDTFDVTAWLSEDDGVPLRVESTSEATYPSGRQMKMDLSLEITDVNSDDINIEAPV